SCQAPMTDLSASVRFVRDKRGYEYVSIVRPGGGRRRQSGQSRILYWSRTPPGVRIARAAVDEEARRMIEARNPDLRFDWPRLMASVAAATQSERRPDAAVFSRSRRPNPHDEAPHEAASGEAPVETESSPVDPAVTASPAVSGAASSGHRSRRRRRRGRHGNAGPAGLPNASPMPNPEHHESEIPDSGDAEADAASRDPES